jgi:hypothetical protein
VAGKTRLDNKLIARICKHVEGGSYPDDAAVAEGVPLRTYQHWVSLGTAEDAPEDSPYAAFVFALDRARARGRVALVKDVRSGDTQTRRKAKAAAWLLERTHSKRFGAIIRHKVEDELKRLLEVAKKTLDPGQYRKLCEALSGLDEMDERVAGGTDPASLQ